MKLEKREVRSTPVTLDDFYDAIGRFVDVAFPFMHEHGWIARGEGEASPREALRATAESLVDDVLVGLSGADQDPTTYSAETAHVLVTGYLEDGNVDINLYVSVSTGYTFA